MSAWKHFLSFFFLFFLFNLHMPIPFSSLFLENQIYNQNHNTNFFHRPVSWEHFMAYALCLVMRISSLGSLRDRPGADNLETFRPWGKRCLFFSSESWKVIRRFLSIGWHDRSWLELVLLEKLSSCKDKHNWISLYVESQKTSNWDKYINTLLLLN